MINPVEQTTTLQDRASSRRTKSSQLQLVLAGFLLGGMVTGAAWWAWLGPRQSMSLYWLTSPDNDIYYVEQQTTLRVANLEQAIHASLEILIQGPEDSRLVSAIPPETKLLSVKVEGDDIFLNFSQEFASGGGSTSMLGRITQVLYTVTSHNESARVWIALEGEALETLGGEGLILDQPLSRESFEPSFQNRVFFDNLAQMDYFEEGRHIPAIEGSTP